MVSDFRSVQALETEYCTYLFPSLIVVGPIFYIP